MNARVVHSHSRSAITQIVVTIAMYIGRLHRLFGQPITQMAFTFVYCLGRGRRVHGSNTQIAFTFVYWFGTGGACTQGGGIALVVSVDRHLKSLLCFPSGRQHRVVWPEYEAQTKHVMNGLPNAPKCLPIAAPLVPTHHPSPPMAH